MCSCSQSLPMISAIKDLVAASPVPVVFDHFGGAQAALGVEQPGFADLLELVKSGKAYVKISGAYRASNLGPDYADATPLAQALIAANADRIVWGTDWPHPDSVTPPGKQISDVTPLFQIDDGRLLNQLAGVGAGCRDPQEDPGRQPDAALRVLSAVSAHRRPLRLPERAAFVVAQPLAGFAQAAERKQVKSRDRRRRGRGRRSQPSMTSSGPVSVSKPAEPADLAAHRAHRIADAAAEREFRQRRRRRRTGETDDHGKIDAAL